MTQISTPAIQGPSAQTLEFIRHYARSYAPRRRESRYVLVLEGELKTLGEC